MQRDIRAKHPNLFLIGFPKCGTTAMSHYLSNHPEVFISPIKEPGFYSAEIHAAGNAYVKATRKEYLNLFRNVDLKRHKSIGEATTSYIYSDRAVDSILRERSDAKFIVMIRNPVDASPSMFLQHLKDININKKIESKCNNFEEAWTNLHETRSSKADHTNSLSGFRFKYDELYKYSVYIKRLLDNVDRANVCFILFDDFVSDNQKQFSKVCQFLGIDDSVKVNYSRKNDSFVKVDRPILSSIFRVIKMLKRFIQRRFFFVDRLFSTKGYMYLNQLLVSLCFSKDSSQSVLDKKKVTLQIKKEILLNYSDDIMYVEKLLGRDLGHWRDLT